MNKKITFSILIAFLISFSVLFSINILYKNIEFNDAITENILPQFSNNTLIGDLEMDRGGTLQLQSTFFSKQFDPNEKKYSS